MYLVEELEYLKNLNKIELVEYLQNGLISRATGGGFEDNLYKYIRTKLIQDKSIEKYLPQWIKTCRDTDHFWSFIKPKFAHYEERRKFLRDEFSKLLNYLELGASTPLDEVIQFDEAHIHTQWQKAIERKSNDPEGAITIARTLVESTLKYILDEQNISYSENSDLSELYKEVAKSLNLAPEQHQEQIFKQILGGANGIISGLGSLRNKLGDAHGKSKVHVKPKERHSELAVNLAGSMALFLYKTYWESKEK
jgi:adenylate kinase family enzyme